MVGCPLSFRLFRNPLVVAMVLSACAERERTRPVAGVPFVDDFGDTVLVSPAARIVSMNPTTTELLFALGAGPKLVGRTHYDRWPDEARHVPDLGLGIRPNVETLLAARPELVVLYAASDNRPVARALRGAGVPVIALKVDRIADFARATMILGVAAGDTTRARVVVDTVSRTLDRVRRTRGAGSRPTVVWQLWDAPLLVVGAGSYQSELLEIAGARNAYADQTLPAVPTSIEDIVRRDPDIVLTDSMRAAAIRASPRWRTVRAVREGRVVAAHPDLGSRTSVTLGMSADELARLLDAPGAVP
jgi:iron complex transport system substrate-binding protein